MLTGIAGGTGGRVRVRVTVKGLNLARGHPGDLEATIWGEDLHAPLIERVIELPMDMYGGAHGSGASKP